MTRTIANCIASVEAEYAEIYARKLAAALRPKYGAAKAARLAQAFNDFTDDRPPSSANDLAREQHNRDARARFDSRVRAIKSGDTT